MANSLTTLARLSLAAYKDVLPGVDGFVPLSAVQFGIAPASSNNKVKWTFSDGVYKATVPEKLAKTFKDRAVADVYLRQEADGSKTLAIAFRGTDGFIVDQTFGWGPQMKKAYFPLFKPLLQQIKSYVEADGIGKVLITGHSLGAAMAQYALQEFSDTATTDYRAAIFGSPGAVNSGKTPDSRMIEFEYSGDLFTKIKGFPLISFDHQGQRIVMPLDNAFTPKDDGFGFFEHEMKRYLKALKNFEALGDETPGFMTSDKYQAGNTLRVYAGSPGNNTLNGELKKDDTLFGGDGDDQLAGLTGADQLSGGNGKDVLFGGGGNDVLLGGSGADNFIFDKIGSKHADVILDFNPAEDLIQLFRVGFKQVKAGPLQATAFVDGTSALEADDRIIHNSATGELFYDPDGSGTKPAQLFAIVTKGLALSADDFLAF